MNKSLKYSILLLIVIISTLMHLEHFNKDLMSVHVWRQTQTQSTIDNFYEEDMNILNPRKNDRGDSDGIFRMEFPIYQWLIALLYKIFGSHIIITRIFTFIVGLFSILGLYKLLFALFRSEKLALIGAWTLNFSPAFYYYTINPLPDNFALCCVLWGLALFFQWYRNKKLSYLILSGIFLSIGTLTKLPFIIYYVVPFTYFIIQIKRYGLKKLNVLQVVSVFSFVVFPFAWYLTVISGWHGNPVVKGILANDTSILTILDYIQHNLIIVLPEVLINYASVPFFLLGVVFAFKNKVLRNDKALLLLSLLGMALIYYAFEANAIKKVHDYYFFPFMPLIFILIPYGAFNLLRQKKAIYKYITIAILLVAPFTCYLRMDVRWNPERPGFNKDLLVYKEELRSAVPNDALVVAGNDISHYIFFYYIDKKGWAFNDSKITPEMLNQMIEKGAEYIYSSIDLLKLDNRFRDYLNKLILEKGSIRVYSLKSKCN
jgi:hypothetical protein